MRIPGLAVDTASAVTGPSIPGPLPKHHPYPNPGYLGSSSHATLFDHLDLGSAVGEGEAMAGDLGIADEFDHVSSNARVKEAHISHGAELIRQLLSFAQVPECIELVRAWLGTGANLVLGSVFTETCLQAAQSILAAGSRGGEEGGSPSAEDARRISHSLFINSCKPLTAAPDTTLDEFTDQFGMGKARWESIGLFLIAVSRATFRPRCPQPHFDSEPKRRYMRRLTMHYADRCLDICLFLDRLNDVQLILQYETFILHTLVDGDQSYESWRRLGDLSSSLFALGYHQEIEGSGPIPEFLKSIRQTAFACSYAADKNVSIFLGRPPRIYKRFCRLQQPSLAAFFSPEWAPDTAIDLVADTRWATLCAMLKEDIVAELFGESRYETRVDKARPIQAQAETQWAALPDSFRLEKPMKLYDRKPFELDIMLGIKLNQLHVLFLVRLAVVRRFSEPHPELSAIAQEMLALVVEAIVLKEHIVHSGTSLVWKLVYYGLSAAGVVCLSMLHQVSAPDGDMSPSAKVLRDLSVIVAEVEYGTIVYKEDANYALLAGATKTIKNLLDSMTNASLHRGRRAVDHYGEDATLPCDPDAQLAVDANVPWESWVPNNLQDFEVHFWNTLAEHPFLTSNQPQDLCA
ncbi:Fungal Zn(2)-Cys(6) binuclear cluster domain [Geosmithia morbida]|uniref:Fungal Zn(2)-Cys(6) binuclear cluster domain n=1 Tax=Geosmithia morbida TaxID=1094350 RepID=A0A9P4YVR8_9HYPO|nr:Fungal Zn(2)-Cys(6) binuclear cluster domain [Geosmithia morbida]KAF4123735.1 Fungal Zn(2)-Cys(6) binuclear cluster domain [Geosmithia morbida]